MKLSKTLTLAALCLLGAAGAQAETYQGVHRLTHLRSRAAVESEAVVAAHSPDPYADGYGAEVPATIVSTADPASVHAQAVVAAHSPDPYADGADAGVPAVIASSTDRATVQAEAVDAAHHPYAFWALWQAPTGTGDGNQPASLR
jgi:hypothetical protein